MIKKLSVLSLSFLIIAIMSVIGYQVQAEAATRNITSAEAEVIALENLGAGETLQNRTGRYHGVTVHQIRVEYMGQSFRVFVDMRGNIVRGLVGVTIPEAESIALGQTGGGTVSEVRFTIFQDVDAYTVSIQNGARTFRVIINSDTGEVLRIRESRR